MREERSFWNGRTRRLEVWLDRTEADGVVQWWVGECDRPYGDKSYSDTDEEYAQARADYEKRVAQRMEER